MCLTSPPLRCSILCERDSLIAKCGTFFFFLSSFLHLFSDPDIATEHMYCIVLPVKLFPLMDQVLLYYSTTVHAKLCTEKTVCTQLESGVLV